MIRLFQRLVPTLLVLVAITPVAHAAEPVTIAAAADLQYALRDIVSRYRMHHPDADVRTSFGSSGNFFAQIRNGAPFDLFFSADVTYPDLLRKEGLTATSPVVYGVGRVVLWTRSDSGIDVSKGLTALLDPRVTRVAIANPAHAPYGQRAKESLQHAGLWERIQPKLVLGENISQSAQFVQTGNAQAGIVSLSLALAPAMKDGRYLLLDPSTHKPLEQGYVLLKRAGGNGEARRFAAFLETKEAREILKGYGFGVPAM